MEIIFDHRLSNKYSGYKRIIDDVVEIVLHGTGGGTAEGIIAWMSSDNCERKENYENGIGLFPYEIDRDGKIYSIMPDEDWYYHSESGYHDKTTIGIELVNPERYNKGDYTDEQYNALTELIIMLKGKYPKIKKIVSHDHNRRLYSNYGEKPCPGHKFNWGKIQGNIHEAGFNIEDAGVEVFRIK